MLCKACIKSLCKTSSSRGSGEARQRYFGRVTVNLLLGLKMPTVGARATYESINAKFGMGDAGSKSRSDWIVWKGDVVSGVVSLNFPPFTWMGGDGGE